MSRLTAPQAAMLKLLETKGPFSHSQMRSEFGNKSFSRVFHALERKGLAVFDSSERACSSAKHYAAKTSLACRECGEPLSSRSLETCEECKGEYEKGPHDCPRCCADLEDYGIGEPGDQECTRCGWRQS